LSRSCPAWPRASFIKHASGSITPSCGAGTPHRRDPIEDDLCRHHIAIPRGGKNGIDDIFHVVLHQPLSHQRRLVPRTLWLSGWIAALAFLKPVVQMLARLTQREDTIR
jgi:hypothetical protein